MQLAGEDDVDGTLLKDREHAVGVRVVQVAREKNSAKSGRRCCVTVIMVDPTWWPVQAQVWYGF